MKNTGMRFDGLQQLANRESLATSNMTNWVPSGSMKWH